MFTDYWRQEANQDILAALRSSGVIPRVRLFIFKFKFFKHKILKQKQKTESVFVKKSGYVFTPTSSIK